MSSKSSKRRNSGNRCKIRNSKNRRNDSTSENRKGSSKNQEESNSRMSVDIYISTITSISISITNASHCYCCVY